jgi:hypothetical protein
LLCFVFEEFSAVTHDFADVAQASFLIFSVEEGLDGNAFVDLVVNILEEKGVLVMEVDG